MSSTQANTTAATVADLRRTTSEILAKIESIREANRWRGVGIIVMQVVLTALLGLLVQREQASVSKQIADESTRLSTRLALSQEFYKQRFAVYAHLDGLTVALLSAAKHNQGGQTRAAFTDGISGFYNWYTANSLYVSPQLRDLTGSLWSEAVGAARAENAAESLRKISELTEEIERQMRQDLHVGELEKGVFLDTSASKATTPR